MKRNKWKLKICLAFAVLVLSAITMSKTAYAGTNTTMETATEIGIGSTVKGYMEGYSDEVYYYKITIPENIGNQWITFYLSSYCNSKIKMSILNSHGTVCRTTNYIYRNDTDWLTTRIVGANSTGNLYQMLPGNTYYITVYSAIYWDLAEGEFILSTSSVPDDNWGNFETATPISLNQPLAGELEYSDDIDCYYAVLPNDGTKHSIVITSTNEIDVILTDANGIKTNSTTVKKNVTNNSLSVTGYGQKVYLRVEGYYSNYSINILGQQPAPAKQKAISKLKLTKRKKGSKKIVGKTVANATVQVKVKKNTYTVKSNKKGKFTVKLKKKLKRKNKITVSVSKANYQSKTKTFKVK